jgi:tRNA modification GTPase
MKFLYSDDPIIACSSSTLGNAAIGVIRISGFKNLVFFNNFFSLDLSGPIEPRRVYFTKLVLQGQHLDDICLTYFEGPKSYNGENILELSVHGNLLNIERIIDLFIKYGGCRLAAAGEFSYRALRNKKLTLSQVEGLDLFLNANSAYALEQGASLLSGSLNDTYHELFDLFLVHKSSLELSIDFSEDIGEEAAIEYFHSSLEKFTKKFEKLVCRVSALDNHLLNPEIVIAGLPNAGKSSLFNRLLSDDRAIVSKKAGTTRDFLSETLAIEGVKYKLIDTAGVRDSNDEIESEGIKRTLKKLSHGFFSILLINPFEMNDSFTELLAFEFDLILFTHSDFSGFESARANVLARFPPLGPTGAISLTSGDELWVEELRSQVNKKYLSVVSGKPILLDRHKRLILQASSALDQYRAVASIESDVAILSSELNTLGHCVSELIGIVSPDQVLNSIFSNFCIGK